MSEPPEEETDTVLYDLRVTVDSISGRPVCGLAVGDYIELTESSQRTMRSGDLS